MAHRLTQRRSPLHSYREEVSMFRLERDEQQPPKSPNISKSGLTAIIWTLFSIASIFVLLRLVVRWRHNRRLLFDDCWMILAWVCFLTQFILQMFELHIFFENEALPEPGIPDETVETLLKWKFSVIVFFWTCLWSVKASFLTAFRNLAYPARVVRYAWYFVVIFTALAYVGCWVFVLRVCDSPANLFRAGECSSPHNVRMQRAEAIFSTTLDATSDLMIMVIPLSVLPTLLLTRAMKLGIGSAFCLGLLVITAAILRATQVTHGSVDIAGLAIWGAVETSTAMIVGSLLPIGGALASHIRRTRSVGRRQIVREDSGTTRVKSTTGHTSTHEDNADRMIPLEDLREEAGGTTHEHLSDRNDSSRDGDETAILGHGRVREVVP